MDNLTHQAEHLYNKVKLYGKTNPTPQNMQLVDMSRKLYDDFRGIHNARELERQATIIKEHLYHGMSVGCMQTAHCTELKNGYEQLRLGLRKYE